MLNGLHPELGGPVGGRLPETAPTRPEPGHVQPEDATRAPRADLVASPTPALPPRAPIMPQAPLAAPSPAERDTWWRSAAAWTLRQVLGVWNDVRLDESGIQHLKADGPITGAICLITNHTGLDDPPRALAHLWPSLRLIPVVTESMRFAPGLKQAMDLVHGIAVPDTTNPAGAGPEIERLAQQITDAIAAGHNVGWYPSGEILKEVRERMGSHQLLALVEKKLAERGIEPKILVAQQEGGNGGAFTRAGNDGKSPDLGRAVGEELGGVLENIKKHPLRALTRGLAKERRPVTIRVTDRTEELGRLDTHAQNERLETLANVPDPKTGRPNQPRRYPVAYDDPRGVELVPEATRSAEAQKGTLSPAERAARATKVRAHLAELVGLPLDEVTDDKLLTDLGLSSIQIGIGVLSWVNKEFSRAFASVDAFGLRPTVGDVIKGAAGEIAETSGLEFKPVSDAWKAQRVHGERAALLAGAKGIADAFVRAAKAHPNRVVERDEILGEVTYEKLAGIVSMLAKRMEKLPGRSVGLLVPTSVIGKATYLACLFAGKRVVPFNPQWTDAQAAHAMDATGVQKIIAPMQVLRMLKAKRIRDDEDALKSGKTTKEAISADRTETPYKSIEDRFTVLDDAVRSFGLEEMVGATTKAGNLLGGTGIQQLEKRLPKVPKDAVILCTSGSTGLPKPVRHSNARVLATMKAMAEVLDLKTNDVVLNLAPFFHLVGYMTGMMSLLMDVPSVSIPDPRAAAMSAKSAELVQATLTVGPPSLLQAMAKVAGENGLPSFTRMVWGAEAMQAEQLADLQRAAPNAEVRAGYGSTEQNVTIIQRRALTDAQKRALVARGLDPLRVLGEPLPGLDWKLVDPDTGKEVVGDAAGLFVMRELGTMTPDEGYVGVKKPEAFRELTGKTYHDSGDLMRHVRLEDPELGRPVDLLVYCDRMGRFSKIGGEMIGHEAIEKALRPILPAAPNGEYSVLVVPGQNQDAAPVAYVTSTEDAAGQPLSMKKVHATLMEAFENNPNYAVSEVRVVPSIEALGTGKVNLGKYAALAKAPHDGPVLRLGRA